MSTRSPRSIAKILEQVGNSDLRSLTARGRQIADLEHQILACLPAELSGNCRVGGISDGCLRLFTATPAWASRLRFEAPQLLQILARLGITSVRSVQVRITPAASASSAPVHSVRLSQDNAKLLEQTARAIRDPRLAQALARLARRGRRAEPTDSGDT